MEIKHQTICSYLVFYTTVLHRWKKWILATRHEAHSHCYLMYVDIHAHAQSLRSCPTLCDPMDCSLPGTSVHRISQARILEQVAISSSRESFRPKDQTLISQFLSQMHLNTLKKKKRSAVSKATAFPLTNPCLPNVEYQIP